MMKMIYSRQTRPVRVVSRLFAVVAMTLALSSCFMPIRFDTEIEFSRTGFYKFTFDGYIADVGMFEKLKKREMTRAEEKEKVKVILAQLKSDGDASGVKYIKKGHFKIHWEREGDILKAKTVTFIRRNEYMYGIAYNKKTGRVLLQGRSIARKAKIQINDLGLPMQGNIRVITDAKVISHNATKVKRYYKRGPRFKMYSWKIKNIFAATPTMTIALH